MIVPFFFRHIQYHKGRTLAVVIMCAVFAFAFCSMKADSVEVEQRIQEVYQNIPVRCAVTNPKGTQLSGLNIPYSIIRLFLPNEGEDTSFQNYITDVQGNILLHCYYSGKNTSLNGITSLEAMPSINGLQWKSGYDESIFSEEIFWCIAPIDVRTENVQLYFSEKENVPLENSTGIMKEFVVVGTHYGTEIYCSWDIAANLSMDLWNLLEADSLSATIKDNTKLEEFWTTCAEKYFCKSSLNGQGTKRYALAVYDSRLLQTEGSLRQNQTFLNMSMLLLIFLSFGVGLVFSFLCLRERARELWLQYILGVKKRQIFLAVLIEQGGLGIVGICIGAVVCFFIKQAGPAVGEQTVFWLAYLSGTALAYLITMRKRFLNTGIGGD